MIAPRLLSALSLAAVIAGCSESHVGAFCDPDGLTAALAGASAGDEVEVGACRVEGSFDVPAGVTLFGQGIGVSTLVGLTDDAVVDVTAGETATVVRDLSIESLTTGVRVREEGDARVERVDVDAIRGVGLSAHDVTGLAVTDVVLHGPVTRENAGDVPQPPEPRLTATTGIVLLDAVAQLTSVDVRGFAAWGATLFYSETTWTGGHVAPNLGVGLWVNGGRATLEDVEIRETMQGASIVPSLTLLAMCDATVSSTRLSLQDNDGPGMLVIGASGHHADLVVRDGDDAGIILQGAADFELAGAEIVGNVLGGVLSRASTDVTLRDVRVEHTRLGSIVTGAGVTEMGDGIQLSASTNVRLERVVLVDNERVGLLVDLGGVQGAGLALEDVEVTASGEAFGAVMQNGEVPDGWDEGVVRMGAAAANDAARPPDEDLTAFTDPVEATTCIHPDEVP